MIVRDIFKQAYDAGLDAFLKCYTPEAQISVRDYFQVAISRTDQQNYRDRWKAVVIPCRSEVICMFRQTFMTQYHPTCQSDLARLERVSSYEESRYIRLKVTPALILSHHTLLNRRPSFGPASFPLLLAAEVPEPLGMESDEFVKAFLRKVCRLNPEENPMEIQVVDPIGEAIYLEIALARAHSWFLANGPALDSTVLQNLKDALIKDTVTPILICSGEPELQIRVAHELLLYCASNRDDVTSIEAFQLDDLSDRHLISLCENYRILIVKDFASLLITPEGEENMEELIIEGMKLVLFGSPGEDLVFSSHLLNRHFANASCFDFHKEEPR